MSVDERRLSFGAVADLYDRVRPSYPPEAVRWALGAEPCDVADVGAGTGLFTRVLLALGHRVVAVEPDPEMRRKLAERSPGAEVLEGSAESIPLADRSVDAVTAAQAHHWFDADAAHREVARVLRPGGVFAAVWNVRDESVAWVAELSEVAGLEDGSRAEGPRDADDFGPSFAVDRAEFAHADGFDAGRLLDLVHSRSWYLVASDDERRETDAAIRSLTDRLPERFRLPYVTRVVRGRRR